MFSFNAADFAVLAEDWANTNRTHAGIVVTPQVGRKRLGVLLGRILDLLNDTTGDEMGNVFRYL